MRKRFKYFAIAVIVGCVLIAISFKLFDWKTFMICAVSTPYYQMFQMEPCTHHINPVLYYMPLAEAGCHITSLGAPQYGFYAFYLMPIFKLTGLTVFSFSFVMTLFYLLGAVAIITPVFICLKNPYLKLLLVPVLCAVQGALSQVSLRWDPYFQYYPIRFLTPSLAVLFIYLIIRAGTSGICLTAIFSFILGFLIFWNFDSGITTAVAWLIFFLLFAFVETFKRGGMAHRASCQMLAAAAMLALGACTFMFILIHSDRSGMALDNLFKVQKIFYLSGFSMLPIPRSLHPWMAVLAVYLISLLVTLPSILQAGSKCSCRRQLLFFISVLGTGLFSYYQGRSHDMVLPAVTWPAFLCCFLACDWLFSVDDAKKMNTFRFLALPFMILCISLSLRLALNSQWYLERIALLNYSLTSNELNSKTLPFQCTVKWLAGFKSEPPGSVLIISPAESLFYVESGLRPLRMLPSEQERFILRRQEEEILKLIRSGSVRHLFMTPYWINTPEQNRLMEAIVTNYKREETPSTLLLRHWTFKEQ
ncbi:MAG: hypothetical protein NT118_14335 [Lentisphaerae bacterium]|nr:hypothetical protein [Lentisphaerota bacterium]